MLVVAISKVGCSSYPKNEFSLGASVLHSVEEYVDGLGTILLQVFVIKGIGCIIFHLYSCWGL